jgi:hypothetical protein
MAGVIVADSSEGRSNEENPDARIFNAFSTMRWAAEALSPNGNILTALPVRQVVLYNLAVKPMEAHAMRRFLSAALIIAWAGILPAQDAPDPKAEAEATSRMAEQEAAKWTFRTADGRELTRKPESILRFSNPNVGRVYGDVFVWLDCGCPSAVGTFYKWYSPYDDFNGELKALGRGRLTGSRSEKVLWETTSEDVLFQVLKEAAAPADSAAERLRQMRRLAPEFQVILRDTRVQRESGTRQELRLLTQPVYRYRSEDPVVVDGALFAFVNGTDPEALLLLEARKASDTVRWEFALARVNNDELYATRNDEEVWRVHTVDAFNVSQSPYLQLSFPKPELAPRVDESK